MVDFDVERELSGWSVSGRKAQASCLSTSFGSVEIYSGLRPTTLNLHSHLALASDLEANRKVGSSARTLSIREE